MRKLVFVIGTVCLLFVSRVQAGSVDSGSTTDSVPSAKTLNSPERALGRAFEATGFVSRMDRVPPASAASSVAESISIQGDNTPFLADSLNGREAWKVRFDQVDIRTPLAITRNDDLWDKRDFEVVLNRLGGQIITIRSVSGAPSLWPELSADSAARQLLNEGGERYLGLVDSLPKITFIEALNAAVGGKPLVAEEIIGQCVMYSRKGEKPRPVWIITTRGVPPIELTHYSHRTSKGVKDRYRCVVDATTGEWEMLTTELRPDPTR